jgi:2-polyprenyl-3-methyl-5-hydroxy-6-metoxy-1,4-benzoquinol methylase
MEKADSTCIICGNSRRSPLYAQDQWQVHKCNNCGLGILDPRPGKDELDELYAQAYFQSHYNAALSPSSAEMKKRLQQENHRLRFFRKLKPQGKVLDIGCGRGYFLLACRQAGYEVAGIDISAAAASYVSNELKIPVHIGGIDQIALAAGSFDVITMWHSLEHTADPNSYLQSAGKWLKDDGILIVDVPNYEGYDARMNWHNWPHWDLPYHFYHFTKNSLLALLQKNGFATIREKDYLSEYIKTKLEKAMMPSFIARIIAGFYSGGSFAVVAGKKQGII